MPPTSLSLAHRGERPATAGPTALNRCRRGQYVNQVVLTRAGDEMEPPVRPERFGRDRLGLAGWGVSRRSRDLASHARNSSGERTMMSASVRSNTRSIR